MTSWQTNKLGEIADIVVSNVDKIIKDDEVKIKLCNYMDVYSNSFLNSGLAFSVGSVTTKELESFRLKKGQVLITKDSETPDDIARSAYVAENMNNVVCGYHLFMISPNESVLTGKFLKYYFDEARNHNYFTRLANGVTRFGLTLSAIENVLISLPDILEQERIVGVLEVWDDYLEKLERKIKLKKEIKTVVFHKILSKYKNDNNHAAAVKVGNLCRITTGKKDVNQGNPNGIYPFFTCSRESTFSDVYSFDCEAILVAGNADVGRSKYYSGKFEAYQRTYVLSDFSRVAGKFLFHVLDFYFKREIESKKQIGAMSYIKLPMLSDYEVSLPTKEEQEVIVAKLDNMNAEIELLELKKLKIEQQKKFLLKNLVSGTIRTPENILSIRVES